MLSQTVVDALLGSGALEGSHVVLQGASEVNQPQVDPATQGIGGVVLTLIVGAILLAAAPNYVDAVIEDILEEPLASFAWGVAVFVGLVVLVFLLAITVVGVILVIPLLLIFVIVAIVGNILAWLAVCDGFVDSRWVALVVAAVVAAAIGFVPIVGPLVGFVISSVGIGAVVRHWRR